VQEPLIFGRIIKFYFLDANVAPAILFVEI